MSKVVEIKVVGDFAPPLENKFNKDILALESGDLAFIDITSNGGNLDVLKRMAAKVSTLKSKGIKVATFIPSYANSAGFYFWLLGDKGMRDMENTAKAHYHAPRVQLKADFVGTKNTLTEMLEEITEYQDFTNSIFRASCDISDEIFSLIENSELPMTRKNLVDLGIIN